MILTAQHARIEELEAAIDMVKESPIAIANVVAIVQRMLIDPSFKRFEHGIRTDLLARACLVKTRINDSQNNKGDLILDCNGLLQRIRYIFYKALKLPSPSFQFDMLGRVRSATQLRSEMNFRIIIANPYFDALENITTANETASLLTYIMPVHNAKMLEVAIRAGATVNDDGSVVNALPPLNACIEQNFANQEYAIERLLEAGADPNLFDSRAAFKQFGKLAFRVARLAHVTVTVAYRLLSAGLNINISGILTAIDPKSELHSPLSLACVYKRVDIVREFMYFGAHVFQHGINLTKFCSLQLYTLIIRIQKVREELVLKKTDFLQKLGNDLPLPTVLLPFVGDYYDIYPEIFPYFSTKEKLALVEKCRSECAKIT